MLPGQEKLLGRPQNHSSIFMLYIALSFLYDTHKAYMFYIINHKHFTLDYSHSKKSGVKYVRISVAPARTILSTLSKAIVLRS